MHCSLRRMAVTLALVGSLAAPAHAQPSTDRWAGLEVRKLQTIYVRDTTGTETAGGCSSSIPTRSSSSPAASSVVSNWATSLAFRSATHFGTAR